MSQLLEEILSLILYLLVITFLTLLQYWNPKPKHPRRFSCKIDNGKTIDKKEF